MQKSRRAQASPASHASRKRASSGHFRKKAGSAGTRSGLDRGSHERGALKIPVRFRIQGKEASGSMLDLNRTGLQVISDTELSLATPLELQFVFGGESCYLHVAGQVVFCRKLGNGPHANYEIRLKFSAIREWEERILNSAVQGHDGSRVTVGRY